MILRYYMKNDMSRVRRHRIYTSILAEKLKGIVSMIFALFWRVNFNNTHNRIWIYNIMKIKATM